ncbi:sensor histidine kinase [Amycolatopsis anabasis]|uniref:sensor histidine kinase n=1 Tax=Amycolatopsis anabasis TaxID=1840409 RepID=UPI00131D36AE|nr:sensor histidine kinase [Amycolatopsis anabasis]
MRERRRSAFWPSTDPSPWEPWALRLEIATPHLLLAVSTALVLFEPSRPAEHRAGSLVLAGVAFAWLLATDTLPGPRWLNDARAQAFSFAGLLAIAIALVARDQLFVVFLVGGFLHAIRLNPTWMMWTGLSAVSIALNVTSFGGIPAAFTDRPYLMLVVIVVQTLAIGGGAVMADQLVAQNEGRRRANRELEEALRENAGLHRQLLAQAREAGILDERQRLSREIHDTLAQGLTGIVTQLAAAEQAADDPAERRRHLATASALARENLAEARRSVHALRPEALDSARLPDALRGVARRWSDRCAVPVEFAETGTARPLHPEIEATLLRVTQEALSNVAKHAHASRAGITLSYMEDQVTLDVRDDGTGFDPNARAGSNPGGGFGLTGMRHRVQRLAGTLDIESEPGGGTAISASVPAVAAGDETR